MTERGVSDAPAWWEGGRQLLVQALSLEVEDYINRHAEEVDRAGRRIVVRNGYGKKRTVTKAGGSVPIRASRVEEGRDEEKFVSLRLHFVMASRKPPSNQPGSIMGLLRK